MGHFVSASCKNEKCRICKAPATHKAGEEISADDPNPTRRNLTAYLCCEHFRIIFGNAAHHQSEDPSKSAIFEKTLQVCRSGEHALQKIYTGHRDTVSEEVVRWCKNCGSVVVDVDYDGRINQGQMMQMRTPTIMKINAG